MPRGQSQTSAIRVNAREREAKAFELRKAGLGYAAIGVALGCSTTTAYNSVRRVLDRLAKKTNEAAEHLRQLETARLDLLLSVLWTKASVGHQGAIDRVLRIMERRARLLGLDAPAGLNVDLNANVAGTVTAYMPENGRDNKEGEKE